MTTFQVQGREIEVYDIDKDEFFDVTLDFASDMATGEDIAAASSVVSPTGELVIFQTTFTGDKAQVWLDPGGAVNGTLYHITTRVTTNSNPPREFEHSFYVRVRDTV